MKNGIINYDNNTYTSNYFESGGGDVPFIYEKLEKAVKYENKIELIELYVKTAFVDTEMKEGNSVNEPKFNYIIYKNFNFATNQFEDKIKTTAASEFNRDANEENQISLKTNKEMSKVLNNLNTYVYSFVLDNSTGQYYLNGFNSKK